jgi:hypothetical protein
LASPRPSPTRSRFPYVGLTIGRVRRALEARAEREFRRESEQARLKEHFTEAIGAAREALAGLPLVVFIDDLDRCHPAVAVGVLEALKQYFNLDGCTYVLGVDRGPLEAAIAVEYKDLNIARESYLDKIVQLTFTIPALDLQAVQGYLWGKMRNLPTALSMIATAAPDHQDGSVGDSSPVVDGGRRR